MEMLREFLKCYSFLYKKGLAHRDLKPQNILVKKGKMKITDFGSAKEQTDKTERKNLLTPKYASPQQCKGRDHTDKCDVYALGCMLFQFFVGVTPK